MTDAQVKGNLCWHDPINPNWDDVDLSEYGLDPMTPAAQTCGCDNCFYGRDKLAREILRLRALLEAQP